MTAILNEHARSASRLNHTQRAAALARLAQERYDVIVIGGGVTGAGAALDAAARGLKTALIERVDLAAGTSRYSSKLVHGGLRYLAKADLAIAYESAAERHHLMTAIAPHLVRPLANIVPDDKALAKTVAADAGIILADGLRRVARTPAQVLPRPHRVSAKEVRELAPMARTTSGICYYDGQLEDDARLVVNLARTAAAYGADVVTRCSARPTGWDSVELTDERSGETITARGAVVMATGVWSDEFDPSVTVTPSRGSHLVLRAERLGFPRAQFSAPVPGHFGRFLFTVPIAGDLVLLGLTDEPAPGVDGIAPPVPAHDESFLLETFSQVLEEPITSADVVGRFAGLRPLVSRTSAGAKAGPTSDASRKHLLLAEEGEPISITGGKLTTYRRMAEDAIDAVTKRLATPAGRCTTKTLPLLGAAGPAVLAQVAAPPRLVRRYGTLAPEVLAHADNNPQLAEEIAPGCPTIGAELAYAITHEGALDEADLLERRTRVSFVDADHAAALPAAQEVLRAYR